MILASTAEPTISATSAMPLDMYVLSAPKLLLLRLPSECPQFRCPSQRETSRPAHGGGWYWACEKPPDENDDLSSLTVNNEVCEERDFDLQALSMRVLVMAWKL